LDPLGEVGVETLLATSTPSRSPPATIQSGETPISIGWDYLNASFTETFAAEGVE